VINRIGDPQTIMQFGAANQCLKQLMRTRLKQMRTRLRALANLPDLVPNRDGLYDFSKRLNLGRIDTVTICFKFLCSAHVIISEGDQVKVLPTYS
jgi:hypothetical protein